MIIKIKGIFKVAREYSLLSKYLSCQQDEPHRLGGVGRKKKVCYFLPCHDEFNHCMFVVKVYERKNNEAYEKRGRLAYGFEKDLAGFKGTGMRQEEVADGYFVSVRGQLRFEMPSCRRCCWCSCCIWRGGNQKG